jgi:hypothetical protein
MSRQRVEIRCLKHCVGHLAPELQAINQIFSKARESLQSCYNAWKYDWQLFKGLLTKFVLKLIKSTGAASLYKKTQANVSKYEQ